MGLLLLIITWILTPIFELINFVTVVCLNVNKHQFWKLINGFFYSGAYDRDCFANHNYRTGLNAWMSTGGYQFGNQKETMSSVFGKKKIENTLPWLGLFIYYFLYVIDVSNWKNGGHCFASINYKES
jgi:hypothetical protein